MIKIKSVIALMLIASMVTAQDIVPTKLRVGLYANVGTSSLVQGMGMNMNMYGRGYGGVYGNDMTIYDYQGSVGGGVNLTIPVHQRWSIVGNVGYMNRGASYGEMYSSYDSRYRLSYIDVWAMVQYNNLPDRRVRFLASLGLTESTLISARDKTSMGDESIMDHMNRVDIGMVLGPGLEFGLKKKGAIQTKLLYTYGFMNVFRGTYYDNGMHSNNAAFTLQVGYLFN